jgi:hypothetical protein
VASLIHSYLPTKVVCEAKADSLYPAQLSSVLARRGYPVLVEPVSSATKKGVRIIDAITVPLADNRLVLLEEVVSGRDAMETVKQLVSVTAEGRTSPAIAGGKSPAERRRRSVENRCGPASRGNRVIPNRRLWRRGSAKPRC